jgi:energy-coupling factor transporter ATP-binding protein EcfA2
VLISLRCQNFRSLETIDLPMGPLTAIVGPNGSGKTSILRALDLVLGNVWPTLRSFSIPADFTRFDATRTIQLEPHFEPTLTHEDAVGNTVRIRGLRVTCGPYRRRTARADVGDLHVDFDPLSDRGDIPSVAITAARGSRPTFRPLSVGTALRDQARVLLIDHRRSVVQHLPTARGSVLGRLLEPARREFERSGSAGSRSPKEEFTERYEAAMEALRTPRVREIEQTIGETTRRTLGFLGRRVPAIDVSLGIADPANPFASLRIMCRDGELDLPAEELGLGVQSAIVVGIFEAFRTIGGGFGTILVEEPEMYLHPQAQRYFYRLLRDLAKSGEAQVIYSTHSPVFADPVEFESIRLTRREPGGSTTVTSVVDASAVSYLSDRRDALKILTNFDTARSEALFASRVLLVEGAADQVAARYVAGQLGIDVDAENLAIVGCGAKSSISFFARFLRALGVPLSVLHDDDVYPELGDAAAKIAAQNAEAHRINTDVASAVGDGSRLFVVSPTLEEALGIGRNADDKPRRVLEQLKALDQSEWPSPLKDAVNQLVGPMAVSPDRGSVQSAGRAE